MKAVLTCFQMVSDLKVNFWKSCRIGVIVRESFLELAAGFPHYRIWQPMIETLRRRLKEWGSRFLSFRG